MKLILKNPFLMIPLITSFVAQLTKFLLNYLKTGKPDLKWLVVTGGMPSAHTASVMALSTVVGIRKGFDSAIFGVTLFFSLTIMYDAAGLRRAAGKQAEILNTIIEELPIFRTVRQEKLRELLGHTPFEVLVGAVMGITLGIILNSVWP